jgi:uncharacterized protein (TIGR03437 family)
MTTAGASRKMELGKTAKAPCFACLMRIFVPLIALLALSGFASAQTPQISAIQNAAPLAVSSDSLARGELISIYGSHLSTGVTMEYVPPTAALTMDGTSVNIGGLAAPILFISPTQLNVQVPFEIPAGVPSLNVTVTVGTLKSPPFLIAVAMSDLGLFSAQGIDRPSASNTVILRTAPGDMLVLEATGLGAVSPAVASGTIPAGSASNALATPLVTINSAPAVVLSASYAGVGLYKITVTVPASADTGSVTVVLGANGGAIGPTGATGASGPAGAAGSAGPAGEPGPAGSAGSQGPAGPAGPTGSLTSVTNYSASTRYSQGSIVFYQGSTYQSSANANVGHVPSNGAPWTMIAQQGAAGSTGAAGATGPTGVGLPGITGATGATGATGSLAPVTVFDPGNPYSQGSVVF